MKNITRVEVVEVMVTDRSDPVLRQKKKSINKELRPFGVSLINIYKTRRGQYGYCIRWHRDNTSIDLKTIAAVVRKHLGSRLLKK